MRDLLHDVAAGRDVIDFNLAERDSHVGRLMGKYAEVPMDFADACLVDLANRHGTGRILTLDSDFRIYHWGQRRPFEFLLSQ